VVTIEGCTAPVTGGGSGIGLVSAARLPVDGGHHLRAGADYSLLFR
jgi:short-subunit dehydrogenase involved in D-alanine esterification of teichoic acids